MSDEISSSLRQHFGFETFMPGQREVIAQLLAGRSAAAVFPTGGGKSLCYQLPALMMDGLTLVVSPLIALMKDQIDALTARGIRAKRLDSSLSADEVRAVMNDVRCGSLKLLYVAPERFANERFRQAIGDTALALFAVDEAHCISEWGHNFRPDYLKLAGFARRHGAERVLALTATATERVLEDICEQFEIAPDCALRTTFYRSNLTLRTNVVASDERDELLVGRLRERPAGAAIVYVTLQRTAEQVAGRLSRAGFAAEAYHAGMDPERRARVQEWFMRGQQAIVVATIAFGMGIDKADIRYVYHYNLPKSLENYSQEIGRAGRDSQPSVCEMFVCAEDLNVLENFVYGDTPSVEAVANLVAEIFATETGQVKDVSYRELATSHDIRPLVVRTLLTYLELEGYLEGGTPFYQGYRFKALMSSAEILALFSGERRSFVRAVLSQARKARLWFSLDVEQAAAIIGTTRKRIITCLDYLNDQGMLEVRAQGVRHRYRLLRRPDDADALVRADLHRRMLTREAAEIGRLGQVINLVCHDGCQVSSLGAHFGEPLEKPCGHCTRCLDGDGAARMPERPAVFIDDEVWDEVDALRGRERYATVLAQPRALARLLCGVSSPQLGRARLGSHELFGRLAHAPFDRVLGLVTNRLAKNPG